MNVNCPACGAEVHFKSRSSVLAVCSFCQSTLVRHDMDIESLGKMSEMPQDLSPLQVGSSGVFDGVNFEVVGRQRIGWTSGAWNEWYILFNDGRDGWLADAQGFYAISFQIDNEKEIPQFDSVKVGSAFNIQGQTYTVDDMRQVTCIASQGELPIKSVKGRVSTSVDLVGEGKKFAGFDYAADGNRLFVGKYAELEDLKMMNLREFDGW